MRRPFLLACLFLAACGGETSTRPPVSLTLAPTYVGLVVTRVSSDGVGFDGLSAFPLELRQLQSAGGRVAGRVHAPSGGEGYEVAGTFDSETGEFRFAPFEATLTSTRTERVDGLGGRADDDFPRDGLANVIAGFVRTSSTARFETDGDLLAVAMRDDLPRLDVSKVTATEVELGKIIVRAEPGFAPGAMGVEVFVFRLADGEPEFRLAQAPSTGALSDTAMTGVDGDIVVLRAVQAGQRGPAIWLRVTD